MRKWRKMTWAILIWTALFAIWAASGAAAVGDLPASGSDAETAGRVIGGTIAFGFIFMLWFVGFIVLSIVWFMSRPKTNVMVYGPQGQQVMVSESEARKRVEKQGWTYRPPTD